MLTHLCVMFINVPCIHTKVEGDFKNVNSAYIFFFIHI